MGHNPVESWQRIGSQQQRWHKERAMNRTKWFAASVWLVATLVPSDALAWGQKKPAYPKELLGIWDLALGQGECKVSDEGSDARFEVTPARMIGYEDWSEPLGVTFVSQKPKTWRIRTRLHIYEATHDHYEIYSLSGGIDPLLAVIDSSQAHVYQRCK